MNKNYKYKKSDNYIKILNLYGRKYVQNRMKIDIYLLFIKSFGF